MSDGADNTEIGNVTIFDTAFFDQDYKLQPIWLGLLWFLIGTIPSISYAAARPGYNCNGFGWCGWGLTSGEWHGWYVLEYGIGSAFWVLGLFWLLAYIKRDDRLFQKLYYRAIAWIIPISWVLALWAFIAFMVGGTQVGGNIGHDFGYIFGFWIVLAGFEALGLVWLAPRVVKFYKWDQQDWWNYNKDDVPNVWPSQLGEFVDY